MNREAIFHNPVSNYAFPISYEKFKVRLRAGKGDLDRVTLVIGNKYLWHTRKEVPMEVEGSDELFDYYSYVYPVDDPRVAYYFLLEKGDEQWLYGDSGFAKPELVNIDEDESSAFVNFRLSTALTSIKSHLGSTVRCSIRFFRSAFATETLSFLRRMWRLGAPRRTDRFLWAQICRVLPKSFPIWKNWE